MQIAFLCEFGGAHGWGHLIRCTAMAQAASSLGWRTILVADGPCERMPQEAEEAFDSFEFVGSFDSLPESVLNSDVLFADFMYRENEFYHSIQRSFIGKGELGKVFVATDDMQKRRMDAVDIVVNPEIGLNETAYEPKKYQLLGEKYCYLRRGFSKTKKRLIELDLDKPVPIFVMIGGTDPWNLSAPVLRELAASSRYSFSPTLLSGEKTDQLGNLKECFALFPHFRWVTSISSNEMAELMSSCALGVTACGSSVFEMAALNIPFVGLSIVDNQTATARKIETNWKLPILHLEDRKEGQPIGVVSAVESLLEDSSRFSLPYSSVDTSGCNRIMDVVRDCLADKVQT
ncbi:hypothetical protein MLD52_04920 [Puniceicoccaceae bacterium K14]|nr:hypothetical protein [Puniceicoccaceae bacterium K14]